MGSWAGFPRVYAQRYPQVCLCPRIRRKFNVHLEGFKPLVSPASEYRARTSPAARCAVVCTSSFNSGWRMLKPRLLGIFLIAAALMFTGAEPALARSADDSDVSVPPDWKNQIIADLDHNKRYLPRTRTRGKSGVVRFEFNMSRSAWELPGTRIVTINPELGRAALLLIQQSQPFSPPEQVKLPDTSFRLAVPSPCESMPPPAAG